MARSSALTPDAYLAELELGRAAETPREFAALAAK